MKTISATEAKNKFGVLLNDVQHEPILVRRQNADVAVVISAKAFEKMRRTSIDRFQTVCDDMASEARANGLTDQDLQELLKGV